MFKQLKYLPGKKIKDKVLVFAVDDYGNVRLDSQKAKTELSESGCVLKAPYDQFDTLETKDDLHALFETLTSVKDRIGNHAVFTPYFITYNIDFEGVRKSNYSQYMLESLNNTYERKSSDNPSFYESVTDYIRDGIKAKLFMPALHGREHVNKETFEYHMERNNPVWKLNMNLNSYASIEKVFKNCSPYAPFDFEDHFFYVQAREQIIHACQTFKEFFKSDPIQFNPPAGREPALLHDSLIKNGIKYIEMPFIKKEHKGQGRFSSTINYTGKRLKKGPTVMVRNIFFEPSYGNVDWACRAMKEIDYAFSYGKPAIVSTHRVNYSGGIDENNRAKGLLGLKDLLTRVVEKYPDVIFKSSMQLMEDYY